MVNDQVIADQYALYHGDCIDGMKGLPDKSIHLSVYSPPFGGLYCYSSNDRDLSNCADYPEFLEMYGFVVAELARITMPGRMTAVHCMDIPNSNSGTDSYLDFPGDVIRLHESHGWKFAGRHFIWKEPLAVRLRTMQKNLAHQSLTVDSIDCGVAAADQLLLFRAPGKNQIPVTHPVGLLEYAGERKPPSDVLCYKGHVGKQTQNRFSHWIWRQYADCMWDDIRMNYILPFKEARDSEDEKHVHPLQLDVIERIVTLRSNPGETVLTPFMGVGSEAYVPVRMGRRAIGFELKATYFRQAVKNVEYAAAGGNHFEENFALEFAPAGDPELMDES